MGIKFGSEAVKTEMAERERQGLVSGMSKRRWIGAGYCREGGGEGVETV